MTNDLIIRPATAADLGAINDIYNYYVVHSTTTYQDVPDTMDQRREWFEHHGPEHPVIVAEIGGEVVAWGSLSKFRERSAYRFTVENSVYVRHDMHRRGIGAGVLEELIRLARRAGHHCIIASISGEQTASIALHAKFGFVEVARLREVGHKFNQWLDVVYMELML